MNEKLETVEEMLREVRADVKDLKSRLYEGNGKPSWAVRLDRIEQQIKLLAFIGAFFAVSFLTGLADWITAHLPWGDA